MNFALILDVVRPGARWRMANTYDNLVATWEDAEPCPTLAELESAWPGVQTAQLAATARAERDRLLSVSDPQALPDYPHVDQAARDAWLAYRQALRDVPEQAGFPAAINWPEVPEV